jgi:hypothetical protein
VDHRQQPEALHGLTVRPARLCDQRRVYSSPCPQPRQTVEVDLSGLRRTEYSFMRPGERLAVIGVFYGDRRLLVATSLIRGPGLQAP